MREKLCPCISPNAWSSYIICTSRTNPEQHVLFHSSRYLHIYLAMYACKYNHSNCFLSVVVYFTVMHMVIPLLLNIYMISHSIDNVWSDGDWSEWEYRKFRYLLKHRWNIMSPGNLTGHWSRWVYMYTLMTILKDISLTAL